MPLHFRLCSVHDPSLLQQGLVPLLDQGWQGASVPSSIEILDDFGIDPKLDYEDLNALLDRILDQSLLDLIKTPQTRLTNVVFPVWGALQVALESLKSDLEAHIEESGGVDVKTITPGALNSLSPTTPAKALDYYDLAVSRNPEIINGRLIEDGLKAKGVFFGHHPSNRNAEQIFLVYSREDWDIYLNQLDGFIKACSRVVEYDVPEECVLQVRAPIVGS